jgi:hypothetical protein
LEGAHLRERVAGKWGGGKDSLRGGGHRTSSIEHRTSNIWEL